MSMSTYVVAYRPPDERWQEMKAVWDACKQAGIDPPSDVWAFFGGEPPDDSGVQIELGDAVKEWTNDTSAGYQLDLRELPDDVRYIRFYNSW